jgi:hypothetical protein
MTPPEETNVIDGHGGFTSESKMPYYMKGINRFDMEGRQSSLQEALKGSRAARELPIGDTLWRPGRLLKKSTTGTLLAYDKNSFYQTNNDVTVAIYKVPGYGYPVILWFDNRTGERIA